MAREIFLTSTKPVGPYREVWFIAFGSNGYGGCVEFKYRMYHPLWQKRKPMRRLRWNMIYGIRIDNDKVVASQHKSVQGADGSPRVECGPASRHASYGDGPWKDFYGS